MFKALALCALNAAIEEGRAKACWTQLSLLQLPGKIGVSQPRLRLRLRCKWNRNEIKLCLSLSHLGSAVWDIIYVGERVN